MNNHMDPDYNHIHSIRYVKGSTQNLETKSGNKLKNVEEVEHEESEGFGEILIHSLIETIEFV